MTDKKTIFSIAMKSDWIDRCHRLAKKLDRVFLSYSTEAFADNLETDTQLARKDFGDTLEETAFIDVEGINEKVIYTEEIDNRSIIL